MLFLLEHFWKEIALLRKSSKLPDKCWRLKIRKFQSVLQKFVPGTWWSRVSIRMNTNVNSLKQMSSAWLIYLRQSNLGHLHFGTKVNKVEPFSRPHQSNGLVSSSSSTLLSPICSQTFTLLGSLDILIDLNSFRRKRFNFIVARTRSVSGVEAGINPAVESAGSDSIRWTNTSAKI